jgi:hypothetical protein
VQVVPEGSAVTCYAMAGHGSESMPCEWHRFQRARAIRDSGLGANASASLWQTATMQRERTLAAGQTLGRQVWRRERAMAGLTLAATASRRVRGDHAAAMLPDGP